MNPVRDKDLESPGRPPVGVSNGMKQAEREQSAAKMLAYLKKAYPKPKSELVHHTPFQFVTAVILSAQCTDKAVNRLTETLFKKYKTPNDFANADPAEFTKEVSSVTFYRNKAKAIIGAAKEIVAWARGGGGPPP